MLGPSPRRSCRPSSMMLFKAGLVDLRLSDASERTSASASLTPNIAAAPNPTPRTFKRSRKARLESPLSFSSRCISWACWSFSLSLILASHLTKTWQQALDFERAAPPRQGDRKLWCTNPVLALLGPRDISDLSPQSGPQRTLTLRCHQSRFCEYTS